MPILVFFQRTNEESYKIASNSNHFKTLVKISSYLQMILSSQLLGLK